MDLEFLKKSQQKFDRYISPIAFLVGFVWDNLTLSRVDLWLDNAVILAYLAIAGAGIILINAYESGRFRGGFIEKFSDFLPVILQFPFGGLFSAFVVFYFRSAAVSASWPFLLVLAFLLVGNEFFRNQYRKLAFHISIYFVAIFSYSTLIVPVLLNRISIGTFLLGGSLSIFVIGLFLFFASFAIKPRIAEAKKNLIISIGFIFAAFNIFYFTNLIPPIPLALKEAGVYHSVTRKAEGYEVIFEPQGWYEFFQDTSDIFHRQSGEPVFVYSAVFAPGKISTDIFHRWEYYDEKNNSWRTTDRLSFAIIGGRDGGYRGYTQKSAVYPGSWRVGIENSRGQLLGRIYFEIAEGNASELKTEIR